MKRIIKYFFILKMTVKAVPVWSIYTIFNSIIGVVCSVLGSTVLVDVVLKGIYLNHDFFTIAVPVLIIQLFIMFGGISTSIYYGILDPIARQKINKKITLRLVNSMMTTEISDLDNSNFLNKSTFLLNQLENRTTGSVYFISNLTANIVGLVASAAIIGFFNVEIFFLVFFVIILSILLNYLITKFQFKMDCDLVLPQRKKNYVERTYYMKKFALEIRIFPIKQFLQNIYNGAIKDTMDIIHKYGFKIGLFTFVRSYNQEIVLYWGSMVIILIKLFKGDILIDPMSVIPMTIAIYGLSNYILALTGTFNSLKENQLYADELFNFFCIANKPVENKKILSNNNHAISFHNVSFKYSNNEKFVLKNVNLDFLPGEKIAFVGVNGSGKSTIVKLLLGLYTDYSGEITIDGKSITKYNIQSYRQQFSVVQQNFQQYACTVSENILMDNVDPDDLERIYNSLKLVDLDLNLSYDDLLTKEVTSEFCSDGLILSKGQYQKLALARVLASTRNFIILDEPTSSLDPISEHRIFEQMINELKGKTMVIISHRLTVTKNVDKIYVIDNGEIIEKGNHQQLLKLGGKYAEMYSLQSNKYS